MRLCVCGVGVWVGVNQGNTPCWCQITDLDPTGSPLGGPGEAEEEETNRH